MKGKGENVDKQRKDYLAPFHAPTLNKWVVIERSAIAKARRGARLLELYLFEDEGKANAAYVALVGAEAQARVVH